MLNKRRYYAAIPQPENNKLLIDWPKLWESGDDVAVYWREMARNSGESKSLPEMYWRIYEMAAAVRHNFASKIYRGLARRGSAYWKWVYSGIVRRHIVMKNIVNLETNVINVYLETQALPNEMRTNL